MINLYYDYWTGHVDDVTSTLMRSVGQYTRMYKHVKVGITNNPERRVIEHYKSGKRWRHMAVKYRTNSIRSIDQIERDLIDYHWFNVTNKVGGGGGPKGAPPYYLYVLFN